MKYCESGTVDEKYCESGTNPVKYCESGANPKKFAAVVPVYETYIGPR